MSKIVDINGNGFKKPALTDDGFGMLVTLSFHGNPDLIYSNDQDLTFLRDELTMELIISKEDVQKVAILDKYEKFRAKLEALLHAVSHTCLALAKPSGQEGNESVE